MAAEPRNTTRALRAATDGPPARPSADHRTVGVARDERWSCRSCTGLDARAEKREGAAGHAVLVASCTIGGKGGDLGFFLLLRFGFSRASA